MTILRVLDVISDVRECDVCGSSVYSIVDFDFEYIKDKGADMQDIKEGNDRGYWCDICDEYYLYSSEEEMRDTWIYNPMFDLYINGYFKTVVDGEYLERIMGEKIKNNKELVETALVLGKLKKFRD